MAGKLVNKFRGRLSGDEADMIAEIQDAFTRAVERAGESTVKVTTSWALRGRPYGPFPRGGHGSGVVLDREGHVLTSHHVVDEAEKVIVTLPDGRTISGGVVGSDEETDVAVVAIDARDAKPATFGDSDALKVGQPVLAIGNPLGLSGGPTVTMGVIGSLRRRVQARGIFLPMIQTDAAVNPGNSGGPLIDLEGRVVGINAITIPYAEGMSFAVPINRALAVAKQLLEHGRVPRPWLGVVGYDVDRRLAYHYGLTTSRGVFVVDVNAGGPAETSGLRIGDVLIALDGKGLGDVGDLVEILREKKIGDAIEIEFERLGRKSRARATLGTRPS